ncbi:peptidoglycan-binding protein [Sinorhizobium medicae]|uniref:Peptidoglycan-binding domain 1 protein n=1 Tax=Sinorhizobium medicae TaxID=110321 RepID=A0A508X6U9_9HYPH|nr:peptidoglycan-binding protein [Sinorhizobium medicae]MDX0423436.1 peptidoglycan-binding protein [Sinorhizobium medicae]MDX0521481.1 peptidoglycan-binding protein [Sinorhizobium medicae]MDX0545794.1 peptidoglycan-binding protein [Sinorhizobium medicae]MDX0633300.1 peptidoglycan-binding protein [Sinorhizobium medicae]MDX0713501.1 peptidoglycan-binding protein [Sinorhizobium medicae]
MAPRKRKQPERNRAARRGAGLALRGLALVGRGLVLAGRLVSRHPLSAGGTAIFAVVFSFVAANAMWYQHGRHPSPLLRTRVPLVSPEVAERLAAAKGEPVQRRNVTTFVIEREGETPVRDAAPDGSNERGAPLSGAPDAQASTLIADIQKELARLGLYEGTPDGQSGPKTSAAILRFEKQAGRMETGTPSAGLLQALRSAGGTPALVATPANRPYSDPKTVPADADPVAAAIRSAEKDDGLEPRRGVPVSSEMVMNIQKGLSNLAYADVVVDGVAGDQTRAAIRHFEKHYRLPQTGEPNAKVLKKLKEIGAL